MQAIWLYSQEIAREKAGIFKPGVPALSVPQPPDAMAALQVPSLPYVSTS
jgi:folylpolyglutamate synthase/dihydropteroate synthase